MELEGVRLSEKYSSIDNVVHNLVQECLADSENAEDPSELSIPINAIDEVCMVRDFEPAQGYDEIPQESWDQLRSLLRREVEEKGVTVV